MPDFVLEKKQTLQKGLKPRDPDAKPQCHPCTRLYSLHKESLLLFKCIDYDVKGAAVANDGKIDGSIQVKESTNHDWSALERGL